MTWLILMVVAVPNHRLQSTREVGAETCPDEQVLRRAVAERLGLDPFSADAAREVTVRWSQAGGELSAELSVTDEAGAAVGARRLTSSASDCSELAASTALALALIIDPGSLSRGRAPPANELEPSPPPVTTLPAPPLVVLEPAPAPVPPPRPPPPERAGPFWVGAGAAASVGEVPSVSAAFEATVAWKTTWVLLGAKLSFVAPVPARFDVGSLQALVLAVGPVLCVGSQRVGACANVRFGAVHAWPSGFSETSSSGTSPSLVASLGPYVDFAPARWLRLRLFANVQLQPWATVLVVKGADAWRTPLASLQAGVGFFAVP